MSTPISSASAPEALPEKPGGRHTGLIIAAIIIVLAIMASIIFAVARTRDGTPQPMARRPSRSARLRQPTITGTSSRKRPQLRASISTLSALTTTPSLTWRCPRDR